MRETEGTVKHLVSIALGGFVLAAALAHAQPGDQAIAVFVTAAPVVDVRKVDKETETRLTTAIKDAKTKRADLEKSLKAQHGKKREDWPQEAQDTYAEAEEAVVVAEADYAYRKVKVAGLTDSAEDIRKSIAGAGLTGQKDGIRLVPTANDAQLIIEVNGRRSASSGAMGGLMAMRDDTFYISFLVKAGPKLAAERFANVPRSYRYRRRTQVVYRLANPSPEAPWWRFEAYGTLKWGSAANAASALVEDFVEKNYGAMMTPPASQ